MTDSTNKYGPDYQFKGQVKIEDVSSQLNLLVDNINNIIDTYNDAGYVTDINLNDVSEELGPFDYTLSVGGLRKILDAYNGITIGCNVFTDKNKENLYITPGVLLTRNGGYGLPSAVLKNESQKEIWYSPSKNQYVGSSATVTAEANLEIPKITSNESWGKIEVSDLLYYRGNAMRWNLFGNQYQKAYNVTNSTGVYAAGASSFHYTDDSYFTITWSNFPSTIKLGTISFNLGPVPEIGTISAGYCTVNSYKGSTKTQLYSEYFGGAKSVSVNGNSTECTKLEIQIRFPKGSFPRIDINSLVLTGKTSKQSPSGGGISGADDLVKVAVLNQGKDGILNIYEFKAGIPDMRISSGPYTNINVSKSDSPSDKPNKDLFAATPYSQTLGSGKFGIYSKIYFPNRGKSHAIDSPLKLSSMRVRNV